MSGKQTRRRYRCHTCDQTFASWAAAERHADSHGGARLELFTSREEG